MKKWYSLFMSLLLAAGLLGACGSQGNTGKEEKKNNVTKTEQSADAFPVTLKDASDKEITIEKKPEKIVSLMPSNTEILYEVGAGGEVVGVSDNDDFPEDAQKKEKVGGYDGLNTEKIIALKPDLVLSHASSSDMWKDGLKQLEDSGITVFVVQNAESFDQVYETIGTIGKATGHSKEASGLVEEMKDKIDGIQQKAEGIKEEDQKSVFVEISPSPEIYAAGKNTFMDQMLKTINAKNAVDEEGWPKLNEEAIVEMNPDVIIANYNFVENATDEIMKRKAWKDMTAVKEKQVYQVDENIVSRPGPRLVEGVEELAKAVYPETFAK